MSGFKDQSIDDSLEGVQGLMPKAPSKTGLERNKAVEELLKDIQDGSSAQYVDQPFLGALPKFLQEPEVSSVEETVRRTMVAAKALGNCVHTAQHVLLILGEDARDTEFKDVLERAVEGVPTGSTPTTVAMADSWLHTLPRLAKADAPWREMLSKSLLIYIGTPGKYLHMCTRSTLTSEFDTAFREDRLVVICRGCCMLPIGTQVQSVHGIDSNMMVSTLAGLLRGLGQIAWGHGKISKASALALAYPTPGATGEPAPAVLKFEQDTGDAIAFDFLADYVAYLNRVKLSSPDMPIVNYYDTGMLVSACMGVIADHGISLLTDHDGLSMLRDASIGHTMSKLNQVCMVEPLKSTRSVFNFFIGDGASRLNGGAELSMALIKDSHEVPLVTVFVFNNHEWAIEDNLVGHRIKQHKLANQDFYELLAAHPQVCLVNNSLELRSTLEYLSAKTQEYIAGSAKGEIRYVIVRGLDYSAPPVLGSLEPIMKSPDMAFLRDTLGKFADGCSQPVPIYGCSAFEYIQFLDIFLQKMPEGKKFQYVCGRTDIQAAHMCGFRQPEGKCVMLINDVYGINSIGESLRAITTGFKNDQVLIMIWHPTLVKVIDHFHLHRQPMVWPSLGPRLIEYYVRTQKDLFTFDFKGEPTDKVGDAIANKTPLVLVNMLPEHERNCVKLDVRMKVDGERSTNHGAVHMLGAGAIPSTRACS